MSIKKGTQKSRKKKNTCFCFRTTWWNARSTNFTSTSLEECILESNWEKDWQNVFIRSSGSSHLHNIFLSRI